MTTPKTLQQSIDETIARHNGPPTDLTLRPVRRHEFEFFSVPGFRGTGADAVKAIKENSHIPDAWKTALAETVPDSPMVEIHVHAHKHGQRVILSADFIDLLPRKS